MNTATQNEIVPGMSVQVIDWAEPPNEWVGDVAFLCLNGDKIEINLR